MGADIQRVLPQRDACRQQFWPSNMMLYLDTPGVVPETSRKALIHYLFPHGVHQWISLGRLSVDLSVDQSTFEVYLGLSVEFIRTDAMCLECAAGLTLHKPPQGNIRFRCPPHLSGESILGPLREQMADWLAKREGDGYFLRVWLDSNWDGQNLVRRTSTEVLVIEQRDEHLYRFVAQFAALAKSRLQLETPTWYRPNLHLRIRRVMRVGRAPTGDPLDGFWANGGGGVLLRAPTPGRWSSGITSG